jgi:hypothetical protein
MFTLSFIIPNSSYSLSDKYISDESTKLKIQAVKEVGKEIKCVFFEHKNDNNITIG